jgi:hypothetical protein
MPAHIPAWVKHDQERFPRATDDIIGYVAKKIVGDLTIILYTCRE